MNGADLIVLGIMLVGGVLGILRGFTCMVLELLAMALSVLAGITFGQFFTAQVSRMVSDSDMIDTISFLIPFFVSLLTLFMVAWGCSRAVRRSILAPLDRFLGLLMGLAEGAALIVIVYVLFGILVPQSDWPPVVTQAHALPLVESGALWARKEIPPQYQPFLNRRSDMPAGIGGTSLNGEPAVPMPYAAPYHQSPTYTPGE